MITKREKDNHGLGCYVLCRMNNKAYRCMKSILHYYHYIFHKEEGKGGCQGSFEGEKLELRDKRVLMLFARGKAPRRAALYMDQSPYICWSLVALLQ